MKTDLTGNLAVGKPTTMSSLYESGYSSHAVDGTRDGIWEHDTCFHTFDENGAWWQVDLQSVYLIREVVLTNRVTSELTYIYISLVELVNQMFWCQIVERK